MYELQRQHFFATIACSLVLILLHFSYLLRSAFEATDCFVPLLVAAAAACRPFSV
jgi:hypothetical protein